MKITYPEIGICGLSCGLCPSYHTDGISRCGGCKTESRMGAGCPPHFRTAGIGIHQDKWRTVFGEP
jgi:hypothetical protein